MNSGAVLIGSGPSLNRIDPRRLAGHDTIAFNRSWLAWGDWGFAPRYHACLDPTTIAIIGPELPPVIAAHKMTRFFLHSDAAKAGIEADDHVTLSDLVQGGRFSGSLGVLTDFGNVGAVSMQVLHALGYRKILMVGVDGDYLPEQSVTGDANHFRDDYARGRVPLTPALRARYTGHWPVVAAECERCGIEVRNASPGTVLTCFDTIGFDEGLDWLSSDGSRPRHVLQGLNS
jgi:hypothetical protein